VRKRENADCRGLLGLNISYSRFWESITAEIEQSDIFNGLGWEPYTMSAII